MYYQTPTMRAFSPDFYLPGTLITSGNTRAIKKSNGNFLTVLFDGTDSENSQQLDQETFIATNNQNVIIADRTIYNPPARCYAITILG